VNAEEVLTNGHQLNGWKKSSFTIIFTRVTDPRKERLEMKVSKNRTNSVDG